MANPSAYTLRLNPTVPVDQSIYEESTTKKAPLGTKLEVGERVFRYAKAGAGLTAGGMIACAAIPITNHVGTMVIPLTGAAIGAYIMTATVGATAITASQYDDGYISFGTGTMAGQMYRIRTHDLGSGAAGRYGVGFTLYDPLVMSPTATSLGSLFLNPYADVLQAAAATAIPMGVTMIAVTAGNFFWLQTKGLASVSCTGNAAATGSMILSITGGAVGCAATNGSITKIIGSFPEYTGIATMCQPMFLNLE